MKYRFEKLNLRDNEHYLALKQVEEWSDAWETMKSYSFTQLARHPFVLLAFSGENSDFKNRISFAGHVAITEISKINQRNFAKIGALAVGEKYRGNGLASFLIGELLSKSFETLPDIERYSAHVHPDSLNSFSDNGASIVGPRSSVPPATGCNIVVSLPALKE